MITQVPSANVGPRRDGLGPELIVLHYTAMESAQMAVARLCDENAEVSAHYLIARTGEITQMVPENMRAWHAGAGEWQGRGDVNSRSIGIELDNRGDHPFAEPQMVALEVLMADIMARWRIGPKGVIGHSDMAPGRKIDPGGRFDWARLVRLGLARGAGAVPKECEVTQEAFISAAHAAGFTAQVPFETLLKTTRLRFAPWRHGALCADDFAL